MKGAFKPGKGKAKHEETHAHGKAAEHEPDDMADNSAEEAAESPDEEMAEQQSEGTADGAGEGIDQYGPMVKAIMAHNKSKGHDVLNDHDALKSRIVEHLKKSTGHKEGDSEEHLHRQASDMIWNYKDAKRKEEDGKSEYMNKAASSIM